MGYKDKMLKNVSDIFMLLRGFRTIFIAAVFIVLPSSPHVEAFDGLGGNSGQGYYLVRNKADKREKKPAQEPDSQTSQRQEISIKPAGKFYALTIGINKYRNIPKLATAVNDAKNMAEVLWNYYGFEVMTLLDEQATRDNIVEAINYFREKLTPDDSLLIYYAGHGHFEKTVSKAYWLPVDADTKSTTKWIMSDEITTQLKIASARHILIISDSCYSGTFYRDAGVSTLSGNDTRQAYLSKLMNKTGRSLMASGGNEPVVDYGGGEHSVFAKAILEGLKNTNAKVFTAEEFYIKHVKEMVAGNAEQTPEYKALQNSGDEGGSFIFLKSASQRPGVPAPFKASTYEEKNPATPTGEDPLEVIATPPPVIQAAITKPAKPVSPPLSNDYIPIRDTDLIRINTILEDAINLKAARNPSWKAKAKDAMAEIKKLSKAKATDADYYLLSAKVMWLYEKDKHIDGAFTRALYYKPGYIEAYILKGDIFAEMAKRNPQEELGKRPEALGMQRHSGAREYAREAKTAYEIALGNPNIDNGQKAVVLYKLGLFSIEFGNNTANAVKYFKECIISSPESKWAHLSQKRLETQ